MHEFLDFMQEKKEKAAHEGGFLREGYQKRMKRQGFYVYCACLVPPKAVVLPNA